MNNLPDLSILDNLSPEEKALAMEILKEYSQEGQSSILEDLKYSDFEEIPVDIVTFITEEKYLGRGLWIKDEFTGERKCTVFPYWIETLKDIFPDNLTTKYNTIILSGSIGLGKSFCAVIIQLYMLYRMMCLKDPYQYYSMQPIDKITFSMLNVTLEAAQGVGWDKLQQLLQSSEWFMEHGNMNASRTNPQWQPPKGIELVFGSSNRHVVGRALFCLDGDTVIATTEGDQKLTDLVDKDINVISVDNCGNKIISDTCTVKPTVKTNTEYQIELENGTVIKCTSNHKFLLKDGTYKEAQYITETDELADIQQGNYWNYINSIIQERGQWNKELRQAYCERHHIIPKCLDGLPKTNTWTQHENIIWLTAREHFIAHKLLAQEFPKNRAIVSAWCMMAFPKGKTKRDYEITPEEYETLRLLVSEHNKKNNFGLDENGHPANYGKPMSDEQKAKLSAAKLGKKISKNSELGRANKSAAAKKRYLEHPETFVSKTKNKVRITNGSVNTFIEKDTELPEGYWFGVTAKSKRHIKDPIAYRQQKSILSSGENNGMYGCGYKISGGNNGHATKNYYFEGKKYDCRKNLIDELNTRGFAIGNSAFRAIENKTYTDRLYNKFKYIIDNLTWELKNEN